MELVNNVVARLNAIRSKIRNDEEGVTALEYGLIAALIAVVIIVSITLLGTQLALMFTGIAGKITAAIPAA